MNQTQFQNNKRLQGPKIIKKYGNRKLYDTEQSSYVVLKDIEKMIRNKEEIQVIDNETQDDITIPTLTQIIFSSEKKSKVSPPVNVLKSIIQEGDGSFSSFLAKLGLFTADERKEKGKTISDFNGKLSSHDKMEAESSQNSEQRIANLMNSGDVLNSSENEDSVPELTGKPLG